MNTPWERIKQERQRLGLSQEAFARLGGVTKRTQINYEKGDRKPDAQYFAGIAAVGANVDYILTGVVPALRDKLNDISTATEMARMLSNDAEEFSKYQTTLFETLGRARAARDDEECLLESYRCCSEDDRRQILNLAKRLAQPKEKT